MANERPHPQGDARLHSTTLTLLRQVMGLAPHVRRDVARTAGLSTGELHALEHLSTGPLGPAEIARRLDVTTAASTGIVDRLESRGHVRRAAHASDRRRIEVHLTPSARAEVLTHLGPMFGILAELDESLDDAERATIERYLRAVLRAAGTVASPLSDAGEAD